MFTQYFVPFSEIVFLFFQTFYEIETLLRAPIKNETCQNSVFLKNFIDFTGIWDFVICFDLHVSSLTSENDKS